MSGSDPYLAHGDDEPGDVTSVARLVDRARSGSQSAYAEIVHRFHGRLFNFLLRRTGNTEDAEDLTQDALVRAWERIDRYDSRWQFSTWLFTIGARLAITRHRRQSTAGRLAPDAAATSGDCTDPARTLADREAGRDLWRLADEHLGATARAALWLHYAEDLPPRDIARVLNRSQVAVRVMLHRARTTLAAHAGEERPSPTRPATDANGAARPVLTLRSPATGGM